MPDIIEYQSSIDGLTFDENEQRILISRSDLPSRGRWIRAIRYAIYGYLFSAAAFVIILLGLASIAGGMRNGVPVAMRNFASMPAEMTLRFLKLTAVFGAPGAVFGFLKGVSDHRWTLELFTDGTARRTRGVCKDDDPASASKIGKFERIYRIVFLYGETTIGSKKFKATVQLNCPTTRGALKLIEIIEAWRKKFA